MSTPQTGDEADEVEDRNVSEGMLFASLFTGALGLFVGLIILVGPRGVVLSLGIVSTVLALISRRRAVSDSERSSAIGPLALGLGTIVLGVVVAGL